MRAIFVRLLDMWRRRAARRRALRNQQLLDRAHERRGA
jgi:hypothetical protein